MGKLVMYLEIFRMGVGCGIDINIVKKNIMDLGFLGFFVVVVFFLFYEIGSLCIGVFFELLLFIVKLL